MPSISKIRIVNFTYNDGKRIIPDELFVFENQEKQTLDTLIDLINGGGKSVIVQLILQPIVPRASIGNRKIEDFFKKLSDHCFILIEWKLDNSSDKMLTGIAMTAGLNVEDGNSSTVKYYTFFKKYSPSGDKNDIINMPLSEHQNSKFKAVSFDEARDFLKRDNKVYFFPSDDTRRYYEHLEDHGILHSEWENVIRKINDCEGGVEKFFDGYKSADDLLNKFIIPGIQSKAEKSNEDISLEKAFLNYADSYCKISEKAKQRDDIASFTVQLNSIIPDVEALWALSDKYEKSIDALFDYAYSVGKALANTQDEQNKVNYQLEETEKKLAHIELEKLSANYNSAQDEYTAAKSRHTEKDAEYNKLKVEINSAERRKNILEAAYEYNQKRMYSAKLEGIFKQIQQRESECENEEANSLKYSLYTSAANQIKVDELRLSEVSSALSSDNTDKNNTDTALSEIKKNIQSLLTQISLSDGIIKEKQENIEKSFISIGASVTKMLYDHYSDDDICRERKRFEDNYSDLINTGRTLKNTLSDNEAQLKNNTEKQLANAALLSETSLNQKEIRNQIDIYNEKYAAAEKILKLWNIDISSIFDGYAVNMLTSEKNKLTESIKEDERRCDTISAQLEYASSGTLHLPKSAVNFLNSTGIDYRTGESYLLSIPQNVRERILEYNPCAAYSVIVSDTERKKLFEYIDKETWVASILPIFTYDDFASMDNGSFVSEKNMLSAYSQSYFADKQSYVTTLTQKLSNEKERLSTDRNRINEIIVQLDILAEFNYNKGDIEKLTAENKRLTKKICDINADNEKLKAENILLTNDKKDINDKISSNAVETNNVEISRKKFEDILADITVCYELADKNDNAKRTHCSECRQKAALDEKLMTLEKEIYTLSEESKNLYNRLRACRDTVAELADCKPAELRQGDFTALKTEYDEFCKLQQDDIKSLKERLSDCQNNISICDEKIERINIPQEEYADVKYISEEYTDIQDKIKELKKLCDTVEKDNTTLYGIYKETEGKQKRYEDELNEKGLKPLSKAEVGSDFKERINNCKCDISTLKDQLLTVRRRNDKLSLLKKNADKLTAKYTSTHTPKLAEFNDDTFDEISDNIHDCFQVLQKSERDFADTAQKRLGKLAENNNIFMHSLNDIIEYTKSESDGDRYYTLRERIIADINRYNQNIARLNADLSDVDNNKKQLVGMCYNIANNIYSCINRLTAKSKITIGGKKCQILKIDLPEIEGDERPRLNISTHIDDAVSGYTKLSETATDNEKLKFVRKNINMRMLLNCYIDRENIAVSVYKIDSNPANCGYRQWEKAITANSGGEKFVVFFALVLSMMNYSRNIMEAVQKSSGVLIMDNPFGPISSEHLLRPMFNIANHFKIQLVCFSHIDTADVTKCFDNVYRIKIKQRPLSSNEIVEFIPSEQTESAFYRSEQLSF